MRNIIPIIFAAATLLAGCCHMKTTVAAPAKAAATVNTNAVVVPAPVAVAAETNAVAATPTPVGPNTPAQTASENITLGCLAAVFLAFLTVLALKRC